MTPKHGESAHCPNCRQTLPRGVLGDLCPACLLRQGVQPDTLAPSGAFEPPPLVDVARLFPQLELLGLIGRGGMGAVYKARQQALDRVVALKILPPDIARDPAFADRFTREAKALARLNHPNIVTIFEFGAVTGPASETDKTYYFLMEYVDGVSLRQLLQNGRLAPREALAIVPQICDALQYAHDHGIVHRDIKPENILLDRLGRVKVADFGLAKLAGAATENGSNQSSGPLSPLTTQAGQVLGSPGYMAPEQRTQPDEVDHRADIYSLGVVFYQMLTGELPGTALEPPSRKVVIDVRLDEVVLRALERTPALRYQQVSDVRTMVETIASTPPPAEPFSPHGAQPETPRSLLGALTAFAVVWGAHLAFLATSASSLPLRLATHFGVSGIPDGWTSRANYLAVSAIAPLALAGLLALIGGLTRHLPPWCVNVPRRDYWLAPHRRAATAAFLQRRLIILACIMTAFFAGLYGLTIQANHLSPPRLDLGTLLGLVIAFMLALIIWLSLLLMRMAEVGEDASSPRAPAPTSPAARLQAWQAGFEYRSRASLFGLPLLHVASGMDPLTGRARTARGIVAIGERAQGVIALGGFAVGVFAFGGFAAGIFAWGGFALALFAFAGMGLGLVGAVGGMVIAPIAMGGMAVGAYAYGGAAYGLHACGANHVDPVAQQFFMPWAGQLLSGLPGAIAIILPPLLLAMIGLPAFLRWRQAKEGIAFRPPAERPGHLERVELSAPPTLRFSRTALFGACWSAFTLLAALVWLARSHEGGPGQTPTTLGLVLAVTVLPLGVLAPLGTTILGCVALQQIRHSAGRLSGLGLALFDALLFPLLVLDELIGWLWRVAGRIVVDFDANPALQGRPEIHPALSTRLANLIANHAEITILAAVLTALAVDLVIIRRAWSAIHRPLAGLGGTIPAAPRRTPRLVLLCALGACVLVAGFACLLLPLASPTSQASLAESPFKLRKLPTTQVIDVGVSKPLLPWAWQELEQRSLTADDVARLMDGLDGWLQREHPAGYTEPLNWLETFLDHLAQGHRVSDAQAIRFIVALHGTVRCEPVQRLREGAASMSLTLEWRNRWVRSPFGLVMMNELQGATVDGQPIARSPRASGGNFWQMDDVTEDLPLPALAPGRHTLRLEVLSALVPEAALAGLDSTAPSTEWPPARKRWLRTAETDLMVYPRDATIVNQTQDPALDPVVTGGLRVERFIIRSKGAQSQAVLTINVGHPRAAVSFDVALRLGDQTIPCGEFWANTDFSGSQQLTGAFRPVGPEIREATIVLTPNPKPVEHLASIDRIWGREVVLAGVPIDRQDITVTPAGLAEPPRLRFLAWQDENPSLEHWRAWHPDGTPVTTEAETRILGRQLPTPVDVRDTAEGRKNPRFLFLWFSHPAIEDNSFARVTLLDAAGQTLVCAVGSCSTGGRSPREGAGTEGWIVHTSSPGYFTNMPAAVTVRLEYGVGPWRVCREEIPSDYNGSMSLGNQVLLGSLGGAAKGGAFLTLTRGDLEHPETQYDALALTRDGRELEHTGWGLSGYPGMATETFNFGAPLGTVRAFRIRTRPIRRIEFGNVLLPPPASGTSGAAAGLPAVGPVETATAFLKAIADNQLDGAAALATEDYAKSHRDGWIKAREAMDLTGVQVGEAWAGSNRCCVVTTLVAARNGKSRGYLGFTLAKSGAQWLVWKGAELPEGQTAAFLQQFRTRDPSAKRLMPDADPTDLTHKTPGP